MHQRRDVRGTAAVRWLRQRRARAARRRSRRRGRLRKRRRCPRRACRRWTVAVAHRRFGLGQSHAGVLRHHRRVPVSCRRQRAAGSSSAARKKTGRSSSSASSAGLLVLRRGCLADTMASGEARVGIEARTPVTSRRLGRDPLRRRHWRQPVRCRWQRAARSSRTTSARRLRPSPRIALRTGVAARASGGSSPPAPR